MPYKVLPVLVGTLMFSPILEALNSKMNLETPKANDPEDGLKKDLNRLEEAHHFGSIFDDYEMGSAPYQPENERTH